MSELVARFNDMGAFGGGVLVGAAVVFVLGAFVFAAWNAR